MESNKSPENIIVSEVKELLASPGRNGRNTMAKVKPYHIESDDWDDDEELVPVKRKKKKKSKKKKLNKENPKKESKKRSPLRGMFSFCLIVLLGCIIWQAPALISQTGLHHKITEVVFASYPGTVRTESVELDWQKPVVIKQVKYTNYQGEALLDIEEIKSEKNLIDFVLDFWHPGTFTISKPVLVVQTEEDRTNWDETIKQLTQNQSPEKKNSSWQYPVTVKIQDGSVELRDSGETKKLVSAIEASMMVPENPQEKATLEWDSQVGMNGRLLASMTADSGLTEEGSMEVQLKEIDLKPFQEILNSMIKNRNLSGLMTGNVLLNWNSNHESTIHTDLKVSSFELDLPEHLQDSIQLSEINVKGQSEIKNSDMTISQLDVDSEPISIHSTGKISFDELKQLGSRKQLFLLAGKSDYDVKTELNIAKICQLLPNTVRLHDDVQIESGLMTCTVKNDSMNAGQGFLLNLTSSELVAQRNSKQYRWEDPIRIDINAHAEENHLVVDKVHCVSDFLTIETKKTNENININLQCNLEQLANRLDSIVDFSEAKLKGELKGNIDYQLLSDEQFQVAGETRIQNFEFQWNRKKPWIEENLLCQFEGKGKLTGSIDSLFESGQVLVIAGDDNLKIHTIDSQDSQQGSGYQMVVKGDLTRWKNRLSPFGLINKYKLNDWDISGTIDGKVQLNMTDREIVFTDGYAYFEPLNVQGPTVNIQQKRAKILTQGTWLIHENRFMTPKTRWNSDSLALSLVDFDMKLIPDQLPSVEGDVTFKGSFPGMLAWVQGPDSLGGIRYQGQIGSRISFTNSSSMTRMNGDIYLDRFVAWSQEQKWNPQTQSQQVAWKPIWNENRIALKTDVLYDEISDQVTINQCDLASSAVIASIAGKVDHFMTSRVASLEGDFDYDFPKLLARLDQDISKNIQIAGKRKSSFSIAGPMNSRHRMAVSPRRSSSSVIKPLFKTVSQTNQQWPDQFVMRAGMGWQSAEIYGLNVGAGDINATLQDQMIDFGNLELDVNQGRVMLHPTIDFKSSPSILSIGTGRVIQGVEITREVCQSWMKFVTPVLADSAEVDGIFSLDLNYANMPLGQLKNSDVQGTLLIHEAQASQGPMVGKMVTMITQLMSILKMKNSRTLGEFQETDVRFPKQQVPFMMKNGSIQHQNLTMIINDVKLTTSGTVNADQSINLIAEIPIAEDWVDNNKHLKGMAGKTLKIPISGTLALPQVDQRALSMVSQQMIEGSAKGLIENQIEKQFNNLLDKIK